MYHKPKTRAHKKKKRFLGRAATETQIGEENLKKQRVRGANIKNRRITAEKANVFLDGSYVLCNISNVGENPASRDLTRRNIITKGAVLEVEDPKGKNIKARVTSRPGQDGCINAIKV